MHEMSNQNIVTHMLPLITHLFRQVCKVVVGLSVALLVLGAFLSSGAEYVLGIDFATSSHANVYMYLRFPSLH